MALNEFYKKNLEIIYTSELKRNLRQLAKKYRHIRSDIEPVIEKLQSGEILGDKIPRLEYILYKVRVRNSDVQKGKSGGYRLIYSLQNTDQITLVTIYSKSEQGDINANQIRRILEETD
ncbi:addiction module antitoxin [Candidatus Thiomargarita nelsonii]|uniref:Addiction module antitoxin n=1 Tax=Candidatus Thiomargarita nelsonii TaxID=1003181 RepID=A0A0A6PBR5_9GAMM|nr:addiction module antitoxin [Candidatus Thiomargarita nelsonii]